MITGPVLIVGTGLLGASLGLALSGLGVECVLRDLSPAAQNLARDLGAGVPDDGSARPALVIVCTPPDVAAAQVAAELARYPEAVVTDVASVKGVVERDLRALGADLSRYVGSHPMAGRERSGAAAADADLFFGRTWVLCPTSETWPTALDAVREVALGVGSYPVTMGTAEHDAAVAAISHLPQIMASLTAARLADADSQALGLAGQGLRDVTRIAASDPMMWAPILAVNASAILPHVHAVGQELNALETALAAADGGGVEADGVMRTLAGVIERGKVGVARVPGKHGGAPRRYAEVMVLVPDTPGQLGKLFAVIGDAGINIEDVRLEHSAGATMGVATLSVTLDHATPLARHLDEQGWKVVQ